MKTVAYFSDFTENIQDEKQWAECIRKETGAGRLVVAMSGNYLQNGLPAGESARSRAKKAVEAGVDMVLEMSLCASLSSIGIYAYSAARIVDRLGTVDTLVLETEDATLAQLTEIAYILIGNAKEFQQRVSAYKKSGMPFYEAQAAAIGELTENGRSIMHSWYNIFAVECIKSLKLMYSGISCCCMPKRDYHVKAWSAGGRLSEYLEYQISLSEPVLSDIYGGYEKLTESVLGQRDKYADFLQYSELIAGKTKDIFDIRKYFLRVLCGVTKSVISIWRMYDFSPYCCVHASDRQVAVAMERKSKVPLIFRNEGQGSFDFSGTDIRTLNRSKREILKLEERAEHLYHLQMK